MKEGLLCIAALGLGSCTPPLAPAANAMEWNSSHSMGCMMMKECVDGVKLVKSIDDIELYQDKDYSLVAEEFNEFASILTDVGVEVYISPSRYFPKSTRGVYYTKGNNIFLNASLIENARTLITVMRHEAWHTVQDCMAGEIDNDFIAIVHDPKEVPEFLAEIATAAYTDASRSNSLPWEKEAYWAGHRAGMTLDALKACRAGNMWEKYPPTPATKEYLMKEGFIKPK